MIFPKAVSGPTLGHPHLQNARLIHSARVHAVAGCFLHCQRFSSDGRLIDKRTPVHYAAIHRDTAAWANQHNIAGRDLAQLFEFQAGVRNQLRLPWHLLDQRVNGMPAAFHGFFLQRLGNQNKKQNHQRREHFADDERRQKSDGHGELHGHAF